MVMVINFIAQSIAFVNLSHKFLGALFFSYFINIGVSGIRSSASLLSGVVLAIAQQYCRGWVPAIFKTQVQLSPSSSHTCRTCCTFNALNIDVSLLTFSSQIHHTCPVQSSPVQSSPVQSSPVQSSPVQSSLV